MSVSTQKEFWALYEKHYGEKLPPCLVGLLRECGYTYISTLYNFQEADIADIEAYIGENLKDYISMLDCCNATTYRSQKKFCFLPAHKKFLIGLPPKVQSIKVAEKGKSKRAQIIQSNSKQNIDAVNIENVDPLKSVEVLESELLFKLRDFGKTNGFVAIASMSQTNIKNMEIVFDDKATGSCQVQCPLCSNIQLCRYKNNIWATSNINKHFRSHKDWVSLDETDFDLENTESNSENNLQTIGLTIQTVNH